MAKPKKDVAPAPKPLTASEIFAAITALRIASPSEYAALLDRMTEAGMVRVVQGFLQ